MTSITDLRVDSICGFSKVFLKINGHHFESKSVMGKLNESDVRKELGL